MTAAACFGQPFGIWTMNSARSTFSGGVQPKTFIIRIEPYPKGEVFTVDRTEPDGRSISSSTILYLDGTPRDFQDFACSGTQSSHRVDGQTVEILRKCARGDWIRLLRRSGPKELVLDITEQRSDGRRFERGWYWKRSNEVCSSGNRLRARLVAKHTAA
jgi:hypothetical protein